ncbi:uncharacterized protein LAJ45_10071 [Morchella importuna]|uniref:uncharacterized protein n=1 Tax=Morchella importuna TaxID=1174673 RepID=UPI001E8D106A|nr:uncharacterized protein LAJ45_10071 [Morchella importuna]KAH8145929.1 hypothetical protein LAJ45_10071 [Morchella importuna]
MRLQVHIIPANAAPSATPVSTFLEVAPPSLSLEDLTSSITNRYRRLYPHRPPLRIDRLQDSAQNDLDLSYTVEDVFSDKASDTLSSIVRVVQASSVRESSIPPESGLRIGQFARRKRLRPTGMMEDVREASNERGLSHSQPLSHSQSVSLQPSRESGRQRSGKRQRLNDFLVGDSMDEREENLAVRNWNNEVVSDPLVDLGAGAGFEDHNYDGVPGDEDNDSFRSYHSSSPGPGHDDKSIPTPEPNQIGPNSNTPIGNHGPQSDPETPEPIQQRISQVSASPELHTVGHTKGFPEGHASSSNIKDQETSRPLQPSRSSGPLHYTPTATEKLGVRRGALAARAGRQTVAEKLAAMVDRHAGANHFAAPVSSTVKPSIYSVPASDEEDDVLPMPKTQTPNSASKRPRKASIVSETASEEADDESSQQILERVMEGEKEEPEKESESERQAIREERESREREAKEKKDKEAREAAAKAAEQRQKAAKAAKERAEKSRIEKERLEKERLEKERLEKERLEKERLEKERLKKEKAEKERLEKEKLEKQKLEKKRVAQEKLAAQKAERERISQEKAAQEQATQVRAAEEAVTLENDKADEGIADLRAAEAALSVTVLRKSRSGPALGASQEKTGALERETAEEMNLQEEKADREGKKKETAKHKREQEALEKKNKEKAEEEAKKEPAKEKKEREALEKKKRLNEQKAEAEVKKEAAKEKKEREALEKKKRLEEQKAEREAKKKEAAEERVRKAKEKAEKAKLEREKRNRQTSEELAQTKEGEVPSQNSLGESEPAIPPTPSQGMKSNLKGSAVKKHPTRVSFATTADTSIPPASQIPIKQTPILPPGYERNNQEAPNWVNTRKTPSSSSGVKTSQVTSDTTNEASKPVTNGTTSRPKTKSTESIKAAKVVAGGATSPNTKLNGKTRASAIKQSMKKLVEPEPESETGSETSSETGSETDSESNDSEAEATKATATALLKSAKTISPTEDVEMPDAPSSPTPKQPFAVAVYNKRSTSDKQVEEAGSDSEKAPPSGQKAIEETESESDSDSKASASGTDSGSDSESDSGATGKNKPTLAKTLFKGRTYGKRQSLSASQSINGSQRYKSLTAMEMAPIPDVREVHQSSQSGRNTSTPRANSPTKPQRSKKPAAPQDDDSEDSDSSVDSSGSSEEEEVAKPQNNALNGRMASASAKRKSGFGGFGFKV